MTYREAYTFGCEQLTKNHIKEATLDARLLLEFICHTNRNDLLVYGDREITPEQESFYP